MAYTEDDDDFEEQRAQQLAEIEARQAQQMEEQERIAYEMEEKVLRNKLNTMKQTMPKKLLPVYTPSEKNTIKKAKSHPSLKPALNMVEFQMAQQKAKFIQNVISIIGPILPWILIGLIALAALIAIIGALSQLMPWLFPNFDASKGATSINGASGKDFYGVRTIYKDDEQARIVLLKDYVGAVQDAIETIQSVEKIETADGTFELEISVLNKDSLDEFALPSDDFDYSTFDENVFATSYPELWTMVSSVVDNVYVADNGPVNTEGLTLDQKLDGIKYFGIGETMSANLKTLVAEYVKTHYSFEFADPGATGLPTEADIENEIDETLNNFYNKNRFKFRTEKLFVKDFIFTEDDDRMSGILTENYVQMIFMPKRDLQFKNFDMDVVNPSADFVIKLIENGNEITLSKEDGVTADNGNTNVRYSTGKNLNIQAQKFTAIDEANLTALEGENSFLEVLSLKDVDHTKYLTETTDDKGNAYLTWTQGQVYYEFESANPFMFVEFETMVDEAA